MSTLTISRVRRDESGNYTCMPSNLHSSSVLLHVLNEEHPEAMKDGRNASGKMEQPIFLLLLFLISTIAGRLFANYSLPGNKGNKISIFPDTIRDQSNSSQARKFKNQNSLPSTIANPQNQSFLFSNSEIRAENANLSFAGKVVFPLHQNEQKFLFANFENQSGSVVGVELLEKYISPCDVYELKKNIKKNFLYRAGEAVKLIDLTLERSNIRTLEPRNQTLELHNRTLEFHNRALQLHNRTIEHSSINLNDETANFGASNIEMEREYYELSIADPGKWIAIHSQAEMDSNKYLNISQDFAVSINIFPYNQRIQEIGSSVSQR